MFRVNFWGYSTVNYFSPMLRYSSVGTHNCGHDAVKELKLLIREAHKRGIEVRTSSMTLCFSSFFPSQDFFLRYSLLILLMQVIMDVVFNHTAEGNENGPILSFRGVDNRVYYMLAPKV